MKSKKRWSDVPRWRRVVAFVDLLDISAHIVQCTVSNGREIQILVEFKECIFQTLLIKSPQQQYGHHLVDLSAVC